VSPTPVPTPADHFEELLERVQLEQLFEDGKTFVDMVPRAVPTTILAAYRRAPPAGREALAAFVAEWFAPPPDGTPDTVCRGATLAEHIRGLWPALIRAPVAPMPYESRLPLDRPSVVPGGRFREVCYWDSYFTMLGLGLDGQRAIIEGLVDNFADFISRYGHIPNGARTYFLTRSQPPVFHLMVSLIGGSDPADAYARYLPALRREHAFWMRGSADLAPGDACEHSVRLPDGAVLNRYWDLRDTPRDESFREDIETARLADRPPPTVYRHLRAAAESGWDFSSRWLADPSRLETIETTDILPVDLNALLYGLERAIAEGSARRGDPDGAAYAEAAAQRRAAMDRMFWDPAAGYYFDYNWRHAARTNRLTAAGLVPLFADASDDAKAARCAATVEAGLLAAGGLLTTPIETGQQWDAPNGWAPLHWMAVVGLRRCGQAALAGEIARRWVSTVSRQFDQAGKLVEKYDVSSAGLGGGGEYALQDGFGWTNGVTRALLDIYPELA
jgi:alpha,alpha-trehalase